MNKCGKCGDSCMSREEVANLKLCQTCFNRWTKANLCNKCSSFIFPDEQIPIGDGLSLCWTCHLVATKLEFDRAFNELIEPKNHNL